jgi:cardiolipin synthase
VSFDARGLFGESGAFYIAVAMTLLELVAIAVAIARARGFKGTLAWIFAIIALPGVGAIAYFLLALPRVERARRVKRAARSRVRTARSTWFSTELDARDIAALSSEQRSLFVLTTRLTGLPPTRGNRLELLTENERAFERVERALIEAKQSIWAEYYIIENDRTGRRFLELLADRARAGVSVKLLYDAVGSGNIDPELLLAIERAGGRAVAFLPVNPLRRRWAVHLRNHRKIIVVDGERAFTGGMNVGDVYSGGSGSGGKKPRLRLGKKSIAWRDTHLSLMGPAASDLALVFAEDWCFATDEVVDLLSVSLPKEDPGAFVAVLPSGPDQETNATSLAYFAAIAMSRSRCYVTSPYFVPDDPLLQALSSAALRGVDVRVLVPAKNDIPLMGYAIRSFYPRLLATGVRIFEYQPSMLHAKTIAIDGDWSMVGSANLDVRSFRLNFEVGALVFDASFTGVLEKQFLIDLEQSREVIESALGKRGFHIVALEGAAQLLSPLL